MGYGSWPTKRLSGSPPITQWVSGKAKVGIWAVRLQGLRFQPWCDPSSEKAVLYVNWSGTCALIARRGWCGPRGGRRIPSTRLGDRVRSDAWVESRGEGFLSSFMFVLHLGELPHFGKLYYLCSKSPTYEWVLFSEHICKSNLFIKSNQVSLSTQLKQSAIQYCTVIGL